MCQIIIDPIKESRTKILFMAEARRLSSSLESSNDSSVSGECLQELLDLFVKNTYRAKTVDRRVCVIANYL